MELMTDAEWREFVLTGTRTGKLATVRKDGRPHVAPIWFDLDEDPDGTGGTDLVFTTAADSLKGRTLRRDPRVMISIDDATPPFAFVLVEGRATLSEDPESRLYWATRIGGRYMGSARAEEYGRRNGVPGELLVRVRAEHVIARRGIAN
jgi:PPOX class probable F420-dependent enzyme